jgi:hypothetical protein
MSWLDLHAVAREHRNIAEEQLRSQQAIATEKLNKKEQECHQLFRLVASGKNDATYEWYKSRVEERVEDTCLWFLNHEYFQIWLKQDLGPLLVTADPGCGKSVLAKYLIDHELPQSGAETICYFFFKDQDQNTSRQALCAILHQLFSQKPRLIKHAIPQFEKNGHSLIGSTESLWRIFIDSIKDPGAGSVIIVLDALDECAASEFQNLMQNIKGQFYDGSSSPDKLRYLLLCRPYEQIISNFRSLLDAFPRIRIPGEEHSETISHEVNAVIIHKVTQLSQKKNLSPLIKNHLEKKLRETIHRTYLWLYLIFDFLENENFKKTVQAVEDMIQTLPNSVNEAYEQILNRSTHDYRTVRKALSIILVASQPLTLSEMNVAMNIDKAIKTIYDLDLEVEADFEERLRSLCGLFISVHHGRIYFLHQTAREFLLLLPTVTPPKLKWHHSITTQSAQTVLAELCVIYLDLFNSYTRVPTEAERRSGYSAHTAFLDYAAKNWGVHFRKACINDNAAIISSALRVCDPNSGGFLEWYKLYQDSTFRAPSGKFTDLIVASHFGHNAVVKLLLRKGAEIEAKDRYHRTPLLFATDQGHKDIIELLIDKGADIEAEDDSRQRPLLLATRRGHKAIVKLLIDKGAEIEAGDNYDQTPLLFATTSQLRDIVELLIDKGADIEVKDKYSRTPLSLVAAGGHKAIVELLLNKGATDI